MLRRSVRLALLLGAEVGALLVMHRLGSVDGLGGPGADAAEWLRAASPEEVVGGTVRLVALACTWWLLASTLLYVLACLVRGRRGRPVVGALVPAFVRRQVERALAVSLMASATFGSGGLAGVAAAGEPAPPATVEVRDGRAIAAFPSPIPPDPEPVAVPVATPAPMPANVTRPVPARHHVVAPGESLWAIAADHASGIDVAQYWARVVETNRAALRSGDPNLIYPGEVVELPPR